MFDIADLPKISFILYSSTLKLNQIDLQNVPTSTGRADVIIRVMKSILFQPTGYNPEMGLILFPNASFISALADYHGDEMHTRGYLISSQSKLFQDESYLNASEHELLQQFYNSLLEKGNETQHSIFHKKITMNIYEYIQLLVDHGVSVYILHENGKLIRNFDNTKRTAFILGDQLGFTEVDVTKIHDSINPISLGSTSYLGSTTVSLLKWKIWKNLTQ